MSECKAASLELKAITKNYGAQRALHETTLSIPAGRFTSILGPSGCGKSTTLMLIAGLERPTSGCVTRCLTLSNGPPPRSYRPCGGTFLNAGYRITRDSASV